MKQRKDNYRAALGRDRTDPAARGARVTTVGGRYVRVTIEIDPDVHRGVERWVAPPVAFAANTGAAALRVLASLAGRATSAPAKTLAPAKTSAPARTPTSTRPSA